MLTTRMEYTREARPEWVRALASIQPQNNFIEWLLPVWEPGDRWQPIHRWTVWSMLPVGQVPEMFRAALYGAHPRSTGHYCGPGWCTCDLKANKWRGGPETAWNIDRMTYEMYQRTGCYGQRLWIVQGNRGGHLRRYDDVEAKIAETLGLPNTPPVIGELPYAEPDQRTWALLRQRSRIHAWRQHTDYLRRTVAMDVADEDERDRQAQAAIGAWLDQQVGQHADQLGWAIRRDANVPRLPAWKKGRSVDWDAANQDFIDAA